MGLRRTGFVLPLLLPCLLAGGCGSEDEPRSRSTAGESSSSSPRAEREDRRAERCAPLLERVSLTYRITATPAAAGSAIGLWMILANRSEERLGGSTAGILTTSPGPGPDRISWGGSSADELWLKSGETLRREVWHDRKPPGWHPVADKVTAFSFYAYAYAPGPGTVTCFIPATVIAPRGLVEGHPSGRWTQDSTPP